MKNLFELAACIFCSPFHIGPCKLKVKAFFLTLLCCRAKSGRTGCPVVFRVLLKLFFCPRRIRACVNTPLCLCPEVSHRQGLLHCQGAVDHRADLHQRPAGHHGGAEAFSRVFVRQVESHDVKREGSLKSHLARKLVQFISETTWINTGNTHSAS